MLGKGLIRLDAKIKKGGGNVSRSLIDFSDTELILEQLPILPLQMLVYTPKGNIAVVGNYLSQSNLILSDPAPPCDMHRYTHYHYFNPHHGLVDTLNRPIMATNSTEHG